MPSRIQEIGSQPIIGPHMCNLWIERSTNWYNHLNPRGDTCNRHRDPPNNLPEEAQSIARRQGLSQTIGSAEPL